MLDVDIDSTYIEQFNLNEVDVEETFICQFLKLMQRFKVSFKNGLSIEMYVFLFYLFLKKNFTLSYQSRSQLPKFKRVEKIKGCQETSIVVDTETH